MSNIKICVYAICKNEEQFVDRFYESAKEADYVCVLDTGSTDETLSKLAQHDIILRQEKIQPWRFDFARNQSLLMVPEDTTIFVCLDLDEVIEKGWAEKLRRAYFKGVTRFTYNYIWNFNKDGSDGIMFFGEKIHTKGYLWKYAVHEILEKVDGEPELRRNVDIRIEHHADDTKSRSNYLPLLEISRQEYPNDDRTAHYLGREYYFHGQYEKAIQTLKEHLCMESSVWGAERCASMRYIAKCYLLLGEPEQAEIWFNRAIIECPERKEPYVDIIEFLYTKKEWNYIIRYALTALKITQRPMEYLCEPKAWGCYIDDVLSIAYWNMGKKGEAIEHCKRALILEPYNERLTLNLKFMEGEGK